MVAFHRASSKRRGIGALAAALSQTEVKRTLDSGGAFYNDLSEEDSDFGGTLVSWTDLHHKFGHIVRKLLLLL